MPAPPLRPPPGKIAVLRANALGDLVFALPALAALRTAYARSEIVLLGGEWHEELLEDRPGPVDRVVVIPPSKGVRGGEDARGDPDELDAFFEKMQEERFDVAVQLHGGGRYSNPFLLRLGASLTVGLRTPDAAELDRWVPYFYWQSEMVRFLEVVSLLGARTDDPEPILAVVARDLDEACAVVPETGSPLVVLHPGATDPRRRWPPESFAAVGDRLAERGCRVIITGTADERALAERVAGAMRAPAESVCGRLSIRGLTGLLSRAVVVVANDTGPLHLAGAVGAATVGIYWCGNLINSGPFTRTRHRPLLSWRLDCPVCGVNCTTGRCEHRESFVADVAAGEAAEQALDLLGWTGGRRSPAL